MAGSDPERRRRVIDTRPPLPLQTRFRGGRSRLRPRSLERPCGVGPMHDQRHVHRGFPAVSVVIDWAGSAVIGGRCPDHRLERRRPVAGTCDRRSSRYAAQSRKLDVSAERAAVSTRNSQASSVPILASDADGEPLVPALQMPVGLISRYNPLPAQYLLAWATLRTKTVERALGPAGGRGRPTSTAVRETSEQLMGKVLEIRVAVTDGLLMSTDGAVGRFQ